jgi:hypothetical protein
MARSDCRLLARRGRVAARLDFERRIPVAATIAAGQDRADRSNRQQPAHHPRCSAHSELTHLDPRLHHHSRIPVTMSLRATAHAGLRVPSPPGRGQGRLRAETPASRSPHSSPQSPNRQSRRQGRPQRLAWAERGIHTNTPSLLTVCVVSRERRRWLPPIFCPPSPAASRAPRRGRGPWPACAGRRRVRSR